MPWDTMVDSSAIRGLLEAREGKRERGSVKRDMKRGRTGWVVVGWVAGWAVVGGVGGGLWVVCALWQSRLESDVAGADNYYAQIGRA